MADKDREQKPVDIVLKSVSDFNGFINISDEKQERPDFVFRKDNQIIGLEHIEIPILPVNGQDTEKLFKGKTYKLYQQWKDTYSEHYEEVTKALEEHINNKLDIYSDFNHTDYLKNCSTLLGVFPDKGKRKHDATKYIELLKEKYPDCDIKISFVLDVGYNKDDISHYQYRAYPYDDFHKQRINDFPFTFVFLMLLAMIKDVHDIYIVWHPFDDYKSKYVKCYNIHFDDKGRIEDSNIPRVWWEFDMPKKLKKSHVKLNLEKEEGK